MFKDFFSLRWGPAGSAINVKVPFAEKPGKIMCVNVEVAVLGSPPVPNSHYGLCGRKATLNWKPELFPV